MGPKGGPGAHLGPTWPAEMGSVSSALARSRNAAVQPGSSPPPARKAVRPAPPAPCRDPEAPAVIATNPRLAPGREETPVAWAQPGSPELSAVLNCTQAMSKPYKPRSRSAAGKSHSLRAVRGARVLAKLLPPAPLLNFSNKFPFFSGSLGSLEKKKYPLSRGGGTRRRAATCARLQTSPVRLPFPSFLLGALGESGQFPKRNFFPSPPRDFGEKQDSLVGPHLRWKEGNSYLK